MKAVSYYFDGSQWNVVFNGFLNTDRKTEPLNEWLAENASGNSMIYWSGEVGFAVEEDAMLCLLAFA